MSVDEYDLRYLREELWAAEKQLEDKINKLEERIKFLEESNNKLDNRTRLIEPSGPCLNETRANKVEELNKYIENFFHGN